MARHRAAVIGLGRMGSTLDYSIAAACQALGRLELVAGADILPERRSAFQERWGVSAVYEDYVEMVEKEKPDLVAVCTTATGLQKPGRRAPSPDFRQDMHAEMAARLADAGVPMLYVEKALACSMRAADEVLDACHRRGTALNTGVVLRFDSRFEAARDLVQRGDIGEPTHAVAYTEACTLLHMHSHSIDMLSYLLGDPEIAAVRGELRPGSIEVKDSRLEEDPESSYEVQFASGVEAWSVPAGPRDFEVIGKEGMVRVTNAAEGLELWKLVRDDSPRGTWQQVQAPPVPERNNPAFTILEDLVDAHESGRPTRGGNVDVPHRVTEACLAVAESHRLGGAWVKLPMENRDLYVFHV